MNHPPQPSLSFWATVRLLLTASRKRSTGRQKRQRQLLNQRSGKNATDWSALAAVFATLLMLGLSVCAAFVADTAVKSGQRIEAERHGKLVVSQSFLDELNDPQFGRGLQQDATGQPPPEIPTNYSNEASEIAERYGGSKTEIEQRLRTAVLFQGTEAFVTKKQATPGLSGLAGSGPFPAMLGFFVLIWWAVMLICQGEGLELDLQRRRHPMWEWLFAHPIQPGAIFFAEMLSPIAANPIYWGGPLFIGCLFGFVYGPGLGMLAAILIGIPISIATACIGKALEIGITLRCPPRSRGALIGLISWLGYASMMGFFFALMVLPKIVAAIAPVLLPLTQLPWPWLGWLLGIRPDGSNSFLSATLICWLAAAAMTASAVWFSVWGANQGLSGNFAADTRPARPNKQPARFGKDPLYRKEFLWFIRDRSAIVQTILIPLSVAGFQVFNLRGILHHAEGAWNYLCGTAIIFGTYFLWILGPKSLASEGSALWIALTWPRGLESLLKAKAWLWSLISSGIVALVLGYAAYLFPSELWKIALVGIGWFIFGRSMAEKAVTLVTITSDSGETQKIPWGRRGAAQLGMLTFAIGILTQQWHIAVMGIVYSYITAAAIWQNFRARLPFLYDPWSEQLPPPPTLMHAMVSISLLVEGGAILAGFLLVITGREYIAVAQAMGYAICATIVAIGVANFLNDRGVPPRDVWFWQSDPDPGPNSQPWWRGYGPADGKLFPSLMAGAAGGLLLGLFAHAYLAALLHIPAAAEIIRKSQQQMATVPGLRVSYAIMAVLFAPFAEEYLFRGLLFRALDREWGGWRAIAGSAAFFAVYHPALAWVPVGLLGATNALLFKKTRRLAPAVVLHMVYNAIVLMH
jgi:membrane protease YdiL (CAAX protease family)